MPRPTYSELLQDPRWADKRAAIFARDDHRCRICGSRTLLQVHHDIYRRGRDPGDYPDAELRTLCDPCHGAAESQKDRLAEALMLARPGMHDVLIGYLRADLVYDDEAAIIPVENLDVAQGVGHRNYIASLAVWDVASGVKRIKQSHLNTISGRMML